jgi:hypothetical protein
VMPSDPAPARRRARVLDGGSRVATRPGIVPHRPTTDHVVHARSADRACLLRTFGCQSARAPRGRTHDAPPCTRCRRGVDSLPKAGVAVALSRVPSCPGSCTMFLPRTAILRVPNGERPIDEPLPADAMRSTDGRDAAPGRPGGPGLSRSFARVGGDRRHGMESRRNGVVVSAGGARFAPRAAGKRKSRLRWPLRSASASE